MKRIVLDSSAIILLSKCGLLETACAALELVAPPSVILETASRELVSRYPDAALIKDLAERGVLKTERPPTRKSSLPVSLHQGEEDALRLTMSMQNSVLATDDGKAIKAARFLKVPFVITPKIVVALFRLKRVSFTQAQKAIEKLGKVGRYSPDIIAEAILALTEVKHGKAHNHKGARRSFE
jgi:predicted nucleic acid-binding protein